VTTLGERLPQLLEAYGVELIFGIPGVHTVELYRGLEATRIRHVTPRHEQGAGFMADGYARASGKVGVCFVITGPGMTNIATAMGQAYGDSIPMLVISSVNATKDLGRGEGRLHELRDQRALVAGVAAFSHTVRSPREVPDVLARAFAVFEGGRPRPVHIEIPLDVIVAPADDVPVSRAPKVLRKAPEVNAIARAAAMLRGAKRPFVVLGGGCAGASTAARALVDALGAVTALTINAKGVLPAGHKLSLGSTLPQPPVLESLQNADVVLAIGTELAETDTLLFGSRLALSGRVIRVDIDPDQLSSNAVAEIGIAADAGATMRALTDALDEFVPPTGVPERVAALRVETLASFGPTDAKYGGILDAAAKTLPGLIVVGDSTQPVYAGNLAYNPDAPRRWFNATTGYGTLGYALPAALGAKLGRPDLPVLAVIGDGGIQFTIGELATAVELGVPVAILVWNNFGYREIKHYMADRGIPEIGVDIYTPDFLAIARGFGLTAQRVESLDAFTAALNALDGPTLIEIREEDALTW
jgi:acetolactate synthase I/II/III large subunit